MIPFLDLKTQHQNIRPEIDEAIEKIFNTSQFTLGEEVRLFESEFANFCNCEHAIGVNSGTSALHLALLACGVQEGDEVITVANTFIATVAAISYCNAKPVFVDVKEDTFNINEELIEKKITPKTKGIIAVHLHGNPASIDKISDIAKSHGLFLIEDAAQAHDSEYKGQRIGTFGDLSCFSFYPGKNLGACGEAGMITTNNKEYAEKIRSLRDWGQSQRYYHDFQGFNYRMEGLQGAILRVKLKYIKTWTNSRIQKAGLYSDSIDQSKAITPTENEYGRHVYHIYAIRVKNRDSLRSIFEEKDIQTGIHYPIPIHMQKGYKRFINHDYKLPVTETLAKEMLSLPIYPELSNENILLISDLINKHALTP